MIFPERSKRTNRIEVAKFLRGNLGEIQIKFDQKSITIEKKVYKIGDERWSALILSIKFTLPNLIWNCMVLLLAALIDCLTFECDAINESCWAIMFPLYGIRIPFLLKLSHARTKFIHNINYVRCSLCSDD